MTLTPTVIEYVRAPWYQRLRWWLAGIVWCWCDSFVLLESPEQANAYWMHR